MCRSARWAKKRSVPIDVLGERARQALVSRQTKQVFLRMDAGVNAQEFLNVIDSLKDGGVEADRHRRAGCARTR